MILADTSGLLAALDPRQEHLAEAARVLQQPQRRVVSPFVLAELDYLIGTNAGQGEALKILKDVARGVYQIEPFDDLDVEAAVTIIECYADLRLGIADALIVVLTGRYNCFDILTLDQRRFRAITGPGGKSFRLLPFDTLRQ